MTSCNSDIVRYDSTMYYQQTQSFDICSLY